MIISHDSVSWLDNSSALSPGLAHSPALSWGLQELDSAGTAEDLEFSLYMSFTLKLATWTSYYGSSSVLMHPVYYASFTEFPF